MAIAKAAGTGCNAQENESIECAPISVQTVGGWHLLRWDSNSNVIEVTHTWLKSWTGRVEYAVGERFEIGPFKLRVKQHDLNRDVYHLERL